MGAGAAGDAPPSDPALRGAKCGSGGPERTALNPGYDLVLLRSIEMHVLEPQLQAVLSH